MSPLLSPPRPLPEVLDDATRREFLAGLVAAGLLAACGDDDGAAPATTSATEPTTITVTNRFGTFQVPANPRRVVGLEGRRDFETTIALDLGVAAIGSNAFVDGKLAPFIDFDATGIPVIEQTEPNLERIAGLRPDLILTRESNIEELKDKLVALAPLVPVGTGAGILWREDLQQVAAALRREEPLAEVLRVYDAKLAAVRGRHERRITSAVVAVVQYGNRTFSSSSTRGFRLQANVLAELGGRYLPFLESLPENEFGSSSFSIERTGELAGADAILLTANTPQVRAEIEAEQLWQRLPAVAANRVVVTDSRTNYGSVYAAGACLDLLDRLYATLA